MILMSRTNELLQLAVIYTAADIFLNTTLEYNYPTVNLEAEACGTPVVTYGTGGAGETVCGPRSAVAHSLPEALFHITRLVEAK